MMAKVRKRIKLHPARIEEWAFGSEIGMWYQQDGRWVPDTRATFTQGAFYAKGYYDDLIDSGELVYVPKPKKPKKR